MDDDVIVAQIIRREGGWVDHPLDRGGPTNFGITMPALSSWWGRQVTPGEIRALTEQQAKDYYHWLLEETGIGKIQNAVVRGVVFDAAVNHGQKRAIQFLQRALGVRDDGVIGPVTLAAVPYLDGYKLSVRFLAERARFFGRLISADHSQAVFAAGWMNRVADQLEALA